MRISVSVLVLIATFVTVACGRTDPADWSVTIQPGSSPAGPNSSEPTLTTTSGGVILSWIERVGTTTHLKFADRMGSGWTPALTAASGDDWFLSYADVPSVIRLSDGTLVAQWLKLTHELFESYDLMMPYSRDNGRTWAAPFRPHNDGTITQ